MSSIDSEGLAQELRSVPRAAGAESDAAYENSASAPPVRRSTTGWFTPGRATVLVTLVVCGVALLGRAPLRARYWAWRLARAETPAERSVYLTALCNAGPAARWGTTALARDSRADVRQYGMLALQRVRAPWSRAALARGLEDSDAAVRRLAALGLALQRDNAVVPVLEQLYQAAESGSAQTACLALERLGTPEAVAALARLSAQPAEPERRAALIDALEALGTPECVPPLEVLAQDDRICTAPSRGSELIAHLPFEWRARQTAAASQTTVQPALEPAAPEAAPTPQTVGARAAAALRRIGGPSR